MNLAIHLGDILKFFKSHVMSSTKTLYSDFYTVLEMKYGICSEVLRIFIECLSKLNLFIHSTKKACDEKYLLMVTNILRPK